MASLTTLQSPSCHFYLQATEYPLPPFLPLPPSPYLSLDGAGIRHRTIRSEWKSTVSLPPSFTHLFSLKHVFIDHSAITVMPHLFTGHTVGQLAVATCSPAPAARSWGSRLFSQAPLVVPPVEMIQCVFTCLVSKTRLLIIQTLLVTKSIQAIQVTEYLDK